MSTLVCDDGVALSYDSHGAADASIGVILCHGYIQNRAAFSVPSRSLVDFLVCEGHAVYAVDLRGRDDDKVVHDLHDNVELDARAIVDFVRQRHRRVVWIGHSMGGIIGAALSDGGADVVVTIGSPLMPGRPILWQRPLLTSLMRYGRINGAAGRAFKGARYARAFVAGRAFFDGRAAMLSPLPLWRPGAFSSNNDLRFALEKSFANDSFHVLADLVELSTTRGARAGRLPLEQRLQAQRAKTLSIWGSDDALAPPDSARALLDRIGSSTRAFVEARAGHIDLLTGDNAPHDVWRPIAEHITRWTQPGS